ncbi:MAG: hypothetical protein RLZZ383_2186 [Pseudomonadota bacterium]|jgi:MFS superfamily sulfate permease-like transporter
MSLLSTDSKPSPTVRGLRGFLHNPRPDALSGFFIFLIALPLSVGISLASGAPPLAGVITAICGGVVASLLGSAELTIKGPAAGMIVIVLGAIQELQLGDPDPLAGYRRALAVGVVAALVQIAFSRMRVGRFAAVFPPSAVHGMMAAIGVIICAKQIHLLVGVKPTGKEPLALLAEVPASLAHLDLPIALLGAASLAVLLLWPKLPFPALRALPAPLFVIGAAIAAGSALNLAEPHVEVWGGASYEVGPQHLVRLGSTLLGAITFPDFSHILDAGSLRYIVLYALIGTLESVLSARAVEGLDPARERYDMDRDLLATGLANLVAACLGGLPMISEIVRSSANVSYGARTRGSNLMHGLYLLAFVAFLPSILEQIPMAALAAMLVATGLRLASPVEFRKVFQIGWDEGAVFVTTLALTLGEDLLVGVGAGFLLSFLLGAARSVSLFRTGITAASDNGRVTLALHGPLLFTNLLDLERRVDEALAGGATALVLDLSAAALIDHTAMEALRRLQHELAVPMEITGLQDLRTVSGHPAATHFRGKAS